LLVIISLCPFYLTCKEVKKKKRLRLRGQDCWRSTTQCSDEEEEQGEQRGAKNSEMVPVPFSSFFFLSPLPPPPLPLPRPALGAICPAPSNPTATFLQMRVERWQLAEDKGFKPPPQQQQQQRRRKTERKQRKGRGSVSPRERRD
jgi:hypothetical protein